jgi:hypothetical protein
MPKRSSTPKPERDENEAAFDAVQHVIKLTEGAAEREEKNPAAVALGRRGGLVGGKARAAALSARRRKQIAKKAAAKRWGKGKG